MKKICFIDDIRVLIDLDKKYVSSIYYDGEEFISGKIPFFRLKFRSKDNSSYYLESFDFDFLGFEKDEMHYLHKDAEVYLKIEELPNGLKWGIRARNRTKLLLEQVELMSLGLYPKLKDEGGKGEIDIPYNEGARVTSCAFRDTSWFKYYDVDYPSLGIYSMYPNMISSPFMSYIHNDKGIFLAMLDESCTPKHIDFHTVEDAIKLEMSVFTNIDYGEDYEMKFDSVMLFFRGNYFDACDIYRNWFYTHTGKDLKTIKEKYHEIPKWYHESPVIVTYPVVGTKDSDLEMKPGGLYPYTNGLKVVDHLSDKTDSKIMALLMQWESTAPWAPPYVWPPYGDVNDFYKYRDELHNKGHYLGLYTSGFGWTNKSYRRDYDKSEEFEKENLKDIMCTNSDGSMKSTVVADIRFGYDICPALEKSKEIFVNEAMKMVNANIDYVQILDQNHGGNPYFCYSDKHGHVPAPGSWQVEETRKLLRRIDRSTCLLGCESAASEAYLGELMFSDNRYILNYHIGEPIPMYSYIYHEFVNNFMGNQICYPLSDERYSFTYRTTYSFIAGDMSTLIIDGNGKIHIAWCNDVILDEDMPLTFIKNINKWRVGRFEPFLHLGKMVKPIPYKCNKKEFDFKFGDHHYAFDAVLSSAYTDGKETLQFFVNYDSVEEEIALDKNTWTIYVDSDGNYIKKETDKIVIPPLSVIAIKIS